MPAGTTPADCGAVAGTGSKSRCRCLLSGRKGEGGTRKEGRKRASDRRHYHEPRTAVRGREEAARMARRAVDEPILGGKTMKENSEKKEGVRVVWSAVWAETFNALGKEAMKAGPVVGVVVSAGAPSRPHRYWSSERRSRYSAS